MRVQIVVETGDFLRVSVPAEIVRMMKIHARDET